MHGEPGSGKSALAKALGRALSAVVIDKDVIKAALLRSGISEQLAGPGAYEVYFALAADLAGQGHSLVLDSPVFWPTIEGRWMKLAEDVGATPVMIECVCADREELSRRLMTRDSLESQPRVLYEPRRAGVDFEPAAERLTLNSTLPTEDLLAQSLAYIEAARASAEDDSKLLRTSSVTAPSGPP